MAGTAYRYGRNLAVGAGAVAGASVLSFATLEDSIRRSMAVANESSAKLRSELLRTARQIGSTSLTSAHQVGQAYLELAQAGYSAAESQRYVGDISRFAIAGNLQLSKAVDLLSTSTKALGLNGPQAFQQVSDAIAKASNLTTASISDLGESLTTKAASAARLLNKDLYETVAVLSAYAASGIRGAKAGEFLHMAWRDLQTAAIKHRESWQALGIQVFDVSGKMLHTSDILRQLEQRFAGLTVEQRKSALIALHLQDRSSAAIAQLMGFSGQIKEYEASIRGASGESNRLATEIEGSLLSKMRILGNQIVVVSTQLGEVLAPYAQVAIKYVSGLAQSFSRMFRVANEAQAIRRISDEFAKIGKVAGAVFGEVVTYLQETVVPQITSVARQAGAEFAKEFWAGFTGSGKDWKKELMSAEAQLPKSKSYLASLEQKNLSGDRSEITVDRLKIMRDRVAKLEETIATAKKKLGIDSSTDFLGRINNIIKNNYGGFPKSFNGRLPDASSATGGVIDTKRPKAPGTAPDAESEAEPDTDISDVLSKLSPAGKKAQTEVERLKKAAEREAAKIREAVKTPIERTNELIQEAVGLAKKNLISAEELRKYRQLLYEKLDLPEDREASRLENSVSTQAEKIKAQIERAKQLGLGAETIARLQQKLEDTQNRGAGGGGGSGGGSAGGGLLHAMLPGTPEFETTFFNQFGNQGSDRVFKSPQERRDTLKGERRAMREAYQVKQGRRAPAKSPEQEMLDRQARISGYSSAAAAQRSVQNAVAAATPNGRVIKPLDGINPTFNERQTMLAQNREAAAAQQQLAGQAPRAPSYSSRAFAAGEIGQHFQELAAERENAAQAPEGPEIKEAEFKADRGGNGGDAGKGQQDLVSAMKDLKEGIKENTAATKDRGKVDLVAANFE
jgi:TP901 family phage tail tape measure protein